MPTGQYERKPGHGAKISKALKGKRPKNLSSLHRKRKGSKMPQVAGERNGNWKGDGVGYHGLHTWVERTLGQPRQCSQCGTTTAGRYEWANVSGEYRRDVSDWIRLCVSCHRKESFERGEREAWNKGLQVQTNTGRTHIRKGQHISPATEFAPGLVPHNKHLLPRPCLVCQKEFQPGEARRKFCSRQCYWMQMRKTSKET